MPSGFLKLNSKDFVKGLVLAILVALFQLGSKLLEEKGLALSGADLKVALDLAVKVSGAYLVKNLFSNEDGKFLGKIG